MSVSPDDPGTSRLRAWLELARISNLPTVFTNAVVGVALGVAVEGDADAARFPWETAGLVGAGAALLYTGGMMLNDVFDTGADSVQRPGRPIPSGRIRRGHAAGAGGVALAAGVAVIGWHGAPALIAAALLAIAVLLYDALHKAWIGAAVFMGACRSLVYLCGAAAVSGTANLDIAAVPALAVGLYTLLLTIGARREAQGGIEPTAAVRSKAVFGVVMCVAALLPLVRLPSYNSIVATSLAIIVLAWLALAAVRFRRGRTVDAVLIWISGFCLIDAAVLGAMSRPVPAAVALACFAVTVLGHRRILGT